MLRIADCDCCRHLRRHSRRTQHFRTTSNKTGIEILETDDMSKLQVDVVLNLPVIESIVSRVVSWRLMRESSRFTSLSVLGLPLGSGRRVDASLMSCAFVSILPLINRLPTNTLCAVSVMCRSICETTNMSTAMLIPRKG